MISSSTMRKAWLILILSVISTAGMYAQKENHVWVFGNNAGLDFNSGVQSVTTGVNSSVSSVKEGVASVSTAAGRLQFYTNGRNIWNRNHAVMPNGSLGLVTESTTQGALIVPHPGSDHLYYVFSIESSDLTTRQRFYYSMVDMRLNNGLGDVVPGSRALLLGDSLSERMTAVAGENCDIWVVVKNDFRGEYLAYHISASGLNTSPVVSAGATATSFILEQCAMIKFSHSRRKMVSASHTSAALLEMADFDPATGLISNNVIIDQGTRYYGICFSPDDSRLYATVGFVSPSQLVQFDLAQPGAAAIKASETLLHTHSQSGSGIGDLKNGPDGKIYFLTSTSSVWNSTSMHTITNPNSLTPQVGMNVISLQAGTFAGHGLPNEIVTLPLRDAARKIHTAFLCPGETLTLMADSGGSFFEWDNGSRSQTRNISRAGSYSVTYRKGCTQFRDTFHVQPVTLPSITAQAPACPGLYQGSVTFTGAGPETYSLTATDGTGSIIAQAAGSGEVVLGGLPAGAVDISVISGNCSLSLAVTIESLPRAVARFDTDDIVCRHETISFLNSSSGAGRYSWDFGDGSTSTEASPAHSFNRAGEFTVLLTASNDHCSDTASRMVSVRELRLSLEASVQVVSPDAEIHLYTTANTAYTVTSWTPEWKFPDQNAGEQYLRGDSSRTYYVEAISEDGCTDTAWLHITVNQNIHIPSAFSPNGDGRNDRFRISSSDIINIHGFQVRNRWGQIVWEAAGETALAGWDGNWNGQPAEVGVYFFVAEVKSANGDISLLKGDITLIR